MKYSAVLYRSIYTYQVQFSPLYSLVSNIPMKGLHNLKEDFIYRALRTDEDPYKDIVCKDPNSNRTIDQHVKDGLTFSSKYISTTAKFNLAQAWIETSLKKSTCKYKRGTTIIKIDMNYLKRNNPDLVNSAYNFTDEMVRRSVLLKESCNYARKYEEVVFERLIPSQAIRDVHVAGKGWIGTEPPRSEPIPISTSTLPSISTPSIFTLITSTTPNYTPIPTPHSTPITSTLIPTPITSTPSIFALITSTTPNYTPIPTPHSTPITSTLIPTPITSTPSIFALITSTTPNYTPIPTPHSTPITSTLIPTPSIFTLITSTTHNSTSISTAISTPLHASTRSLISRYISPTLTTTSSIIEHKNDASSQNTTLSANIYSSPIFNVSDISSASVSAFETSADINDVTTPSCDTAEKRRTGVKRSCEVDSEIKPAKYVCVDDKDTQVSVYIG